MFGKKISLSLPVLSATIFLAGFFIPLTVSFASSANRSEIAAGKKIYYERRPGKSFGSCADCHKGIMSLADPEKKMTAWDRATGSKLTLNEKDKVCAARKLGIWLTDKQADELKAFLETLK